MVGPLIGGFLVDHLSWHWVFFVNVPLGLIVAVLVWLGYHENIELSSRLTIDWWGILWLAISLVTLLLGIQALDTMPALGIGLLLITIIAVVLFIRQEKRFVDPLISPKMFMSKTFTIQIMTATILSGVLIGYQMYFPIWLQSLYRVSATTAGLVVTSSSIMWLAASFLVGKLINRYVPKQIAIALIGVMLLSYLSLIFASRTFPVWSFYVIAMINGIGMGVVVSMNTILSQHLVPNDMVGSATSVLTLGRSLGQTVMAGVYGAILNLVIRMQLHGGITFSQVNNVISTKGTAVVVNRSLIDPIILTALHMVFVGVVAMLVVVFVINLLDPNHKIIR